jgi:hypothetical protein
MLNNSTRRTTDLKIPMTKSGNTDKRYSIPQFCKTNGTRDKRTLNTHDR